MRLTDGTPASKLPTAHKTGTTICGVVFKVRAAAPPPPLTERGAHDV